VYHGFPILEDVEVDGFQAGHDHRLGGPAGRVWRRLRGCTRWESSRPGLGSVFESPYFQQVIAPEPNRWGVWAVTFPFPMTSRDNARRNLEALLPELRSRGQQWKVSGSAGPAP